ncbi:hypothetical protein BIV59_22315 [Bacillus sp. MUM 13]|nr:hypothetical protein BIV59_22315 [Bacillus sp. MUM 13]
MADSTIKLFKKRSLNKKARSTSAGSYITPSRRICVLKSLYSEFPNSYHVTFSLIHIFKTQKQAAACFNENKTIRNLSRE